MEPFDSICHSLTTMPTGGFSTKNASIGHYDSTVIHYIITFFIIISKILPQSPSDLNSNYFLTSTNVHFVEPMNDLWIEIGMAN